MVTEAGPRVGRIRPCHARQQREPETNGSPDWLASLAAAEIRVYDQPYAFEETARSDAPPSVRADALAVVGDDEVWSQLVPSFDLADEWFAVFRFHFPPGIDNSGFVGWLASRLKRELGTGVFVVCGQNSQRGGIYDYWGCPTSEADILLREIRVLRNEDPAEGRT